jgi:hypothetical protein
MFELEETVEICSYSNFTPGETESKNGGFTCLREPTVL